MAFYQIYKITNTINGKIYVGQHKLPPNGECPRAYMGSGIAICGAQRKYGIENFVKEIIEVIEDDEKHELTSEREKYWIRELNSMHPNGYNISPGGEGGITSEIAKKSVATRQARGYQMSKETKQKISQARMGMHFTDQHRANLCKNHHLRQEYTILFEDGHEEIVTKTRKQICIEYQIGSVNTLLRHSAKGIFTNGIMLKVLMLRIMLVVVVRIQMHYLALRKEQKIINTMTQLLVRLLLITL